MMSQDSSKLRILFGVLIAIFSLISYFASSEYNEVTGENQRLSMTREQEIALGRQAAPEIIQQYGGLYRDQSVQDYVDNLGFQLVNNSIARDTVWKFDFHVLDDSSTVNAFALPGGQIFITTALLSRLDTDAKVAGVLAHEIVHVLARHGAEQLAKSELTNGLIGAVAVASGDANTAQTAAVLGQLITMKYGRDAEHESDTIGICLMIDAGYDPNAMIEVMRVLEAASEGAAPPEFFSTHPSSANRIEEIEDAIRTASEDCP